jgi:hypothetical protein
MHTELPESSNASYRLPLISTVITGDIGLSQLSVLSLGILSLEEVFTKDLFKFSSDVKGGISFPDVPGMGTLDTH